MADVIGRTYGRLTAVARTEKTNTQGSPFYLCKCSCGAEKEIQVNSLRSGLTKSCGCLASEITSRRNVESATHGLRNSVEYRIWASMLGRCTNPKYENYSNYGGRGICVAERWKLFINFYSDMGPRPAAKLQLDRVDNDGDYTPINCRWATAKQNSRNRRDTPWVDYLGTRMPLADAADLCGIKRDTLAHRMAAGWPPEKLFTEIRK